MTLQMAVFTVLVAGLGTFGPTVPCIAATLTVTKATDSDDGVCDEDCSLREAIVAATSGDTIQFSPLFDAPQVITLAGTELLIDRSLTISGPGADKLTVSGNFQSRVLHIATSVSVSVSGLTITGGNGGDGGGIYNEGSLTVTRCHITGNAAERGGGIASFFGSLTVLKSTVSNNTSSHRGAGIDDVGYYTFIADSTISGNVATGAFSVVGGIWTEFPDTSYNAVLVVNTTITDNSPGGVVSLRPNPLQRVVLTNTIVAANRDNAVIPDVQGEFWGGSHDFIGNVGTAGGFNSATNITGDRGVQADPKLEPLLDNGGGTPTHGLQPCSLAIDHGRNYSGETDQRGDGFSRTVDFPDVRNSIDGDGTDTGAFELQTFTPAVCNTGPPTIEAASLTLQQDSSSARLGIATVTDPDGLFGVHVDLWSPNPANGVSVDHILIDGTGTVSAEVAASCTASNASFLLTASDFQSETSDTLEVAVTPETTPPTLEVRPDEISLFPNDHKYRSVPAGVFITGVSDNCDTAVDVDSVTIATVSSDEPENADGDSDGETLDDIVIAPDCRSVSLRAERDGRRDGRVYSVTLLVRDASGNVATATGRVTVPLSRNGTPAVEGAPQYTVMSRCQ